MTFKASSSPNSPLSPVSAVSQASSNTASNRAIANIIDKYQKERLQFVQSISEAAQREANVDVLIQSGVMALLKPLLTDPVPSIQQQAANAIGRLASYNQSVAATVVESDILPRLVTSLQNQNRFYKKAASFVVKSIAKHNAELALSVVDAGAVKSLVHCLEEFDPAVKESACSALGYIARHNADLAQSVVDVGAIPLLLLCLQEPELPLKRVAAATLADIARHTPDLSQSLVDAKAIPIFASFIHGTTTKSNGASRDVKFMKHLLNCLANISKHSLSLAEAVVDGDIFPHVYKYFKAPELNLKRASAELLAEIVKHASALSQLVAQTGGIAVVVDYISNVPGTSKIPGVMTLGYIASMSEVLAMSVVVANGVNPLSECLHLSAAEDYEYLKSASCWALGQIAKYSPEHAKHITAKAVLPKLLSSYMETMSKDDHQSTPELLDLRSKAKRALKAVIGNTLDSVALDPLLQMTTPPVILKYVLAQYSKILPNDVTARKFMVTSGGLARIQTISAHYKSDDANVQPIPEAKEDEDEKTKEQFTASKMAESIRKINACFPEEIVRYYSPGYSATLLSKIDEYVAGKPQTNHGKAQSMNDLKSSRTPRSATMASTPTIAEERPETSHHQVTA